MSFGNRYSVIAPWLVVAAGLGLIAILSLSYGVSKGYQSANQYNQIERANAAAYQEAQNVCLNIAATIEDFRECVASISHPTRSEERAEQDLDAQREMADWAEGMLWATIVVGSFTVLAAGAAAWFALGAVRETRRIGESQVRAYVSALYAEIDFTRTQCVVKLYLQNFGQTPANKVQISMGAKLIEKWGGERAIFDDLSFADFNSIGGGIK